MFVRMHVCILYKCVYILMCIFVYVDIYLFCEFVYMYVFVCPCSGSLSPRHGASSGCGKGTATDMAGGCQ